MVKCIQIAIIAVRTIEKGTVLEKDWRPYLDRMAMEGLSEVFTFKKNQKNEKKPAVITAELSWQDNNKNKGNEAGSSLVCSRNKKIQPEGRLSGLVR